MPELSIALLAIAAVPVLAALLRSIGPLAVALVISALFGSFSAAHAEGTCTKGFAVGTSPVTVLAAGDVAQGRRYLFLQNVGGTNDAQCAVGTTSAALTGANAGILLKAGDPSFVHQAFPSEARIPSGNLANGAISCISSSTGTTVVVCDY